MFRRIAWLGAAVLLVAGCSDLFGIRDLSARQDAMVDVGPMDATAPGTGDDATGPGPDDADAAADAADATCAVCGAANCIDLTADPHNCGACGAACANGEACRAGQCSCNGGGTRCSSDAGTACVDLMVDPLNCGACGIVCAQTQSCQQGTCVCPGASTACPNGCVATNNDPANCGGCGAGCAAGASCLGKACVCPAAQMQCASASGLVCVDTTTDHDNCNGCNNNCGTDATCEINPVAPFLPRCVLCTSIPGSLRCGTPPTCVDPARDAHNCGQCGSACLPTQICSGSQCACPAGEKLCGSGASQACVSLASDQVNCGACGHACVGGMTCQGGQCVCPASQHDCGGTCFPDNSSYLSRCGLQCTRCAAPSNGVATCGGTPPRCGVSCAANVALCGANARDAACGETGTDASSCGD